MALREFGYHDVLGPMAHDWRGLRRVRRRKVEVRVGSRSCAHRHNDTRLVEEPFTSACTARQIQSLKFSTVQPPALRTVPYPAR